MELTIEFKVESSLGCCLGWSNGCMLGLKLCWSWSNGRLYMCQVGTKWLQDKLNHPEGGGRLDGNPPDGGPRPPDGGPRPPGVPLVPEDGGAGAPAPTMPTADVVAEPLAAVTTSEAGKLIVFCASVWQINPENVTSRITDAELRTSDNILLLTICATQLTCVDWTYTGPPWWLHASLGSNAKLTFSAVTP